MNRLEAILILSKDCENWSREELESFVFDKQYDYFAGLSDARLFIMVQEMEASAAMVPTDPFYLPGKL